MKDRLRHSERLVSALVQFFFCAPVNHAWFPFKYFANGLLAERPELGDLDDRVVGVPTNQTVNLVVAAVEAGQSKVSKHTSEQWRSLTPPPSETSVTPGASDARC
jgi:hypothetical protein